MPLTKNEFDGARVLLEALTDDQLCIARTGSEELLRVLQDWHSQWPTTREFLRARGLTNVRELDGTGRSELRKHLEYTLKRTMQ